MLGHLSNRRWHVLILCILPLAMVLPGISTLPVIDRDEARFAQASVQMAESNDLLNIRFQDEARNKKPAGAYWAQTAAIKALSNDGKRRIWVHRLPSVLAAMLSILALYWGGLRMVGRNAALIAAALMATTTIFVFEGHIAKTDALLCAATTLMLASLGRLRNGGGLREVWAFWIALGFSILIKGPIGPILAIFSIFSLGIWEKNLSWARPLLNWGAIGLFVLMWLPWGIAMFIITDGAFFSESIGQDLGGKVVSEQEGHGAFPGYHAILVWMALWPASLFLLPGFTYALQAIRSGGDNPIIRSMRLILCWIIPFWVLIEVMPTKLPHYGLPIFPALCLMIGTGIIAMSKLEGFSKTRFIGGLIFLFSTSFLLGALLFVQSQYGAADDAIEAYLICGLSGLSAIIAAFALWGKKINLSLGSAILSAMIYLIGAYGFVLSDMTQFKTSERLVAELESFAPGTESRDIHSPHYSEPSLVYHMGQEIDLRAHDIDLTEKKVAILNTLRDTAEAQHNTLEEAAKSRGRCLEKSNLVKGFSYSRGIPLSLIILREGPCEASRQIAPL